MATINSVMTRDPACCTADESVVECAQMMETEDVGLIPVVESLDTKKLIGVVTDRDLCLDVIAAGRDPNGCVVEDCMSDEVYTVRDNDDIAQALSLMKEHQVRRLPVVDEQGACIGIVSQADLSRAVPAGDFQQTIAEISREEHHEPAGV